MRITDQYISRNYLNNLNNNLEYLAKLQDQQSSGKKIRRPSDNPFNTTRVINLNDSIARNIQYAENIDFSSNWLNTTDEALGQIGAFLDRIGQQINAANNSYNSGTELYSYKTEVQENIQGIADMLNSNFDGSYIFAGYKTATKPLDLIKNAAGQVTGEFDPKYNSTIANERIMREVSPGVTVDINITADRILGKDDPSNPKTQSLGTVFKNIMEALSDPSKRKNLSSSSDEYSFIDKLTTARDNISRLRAEVGARQNRMEAEAAKNEEETYNMTTVMSKFADIDVVEQDVKIKEASAVYQASLMVGAKIIQPSLLDFLR